MGEKLSLYFEKKKNFLKKIKILKKYDIKLWVYQIAKKTMPFFTLFTFIIMFNIIIIQKVL